MLNRFIVSGPCPITARVLAAVRRARYGSEDGAGHPAGDAARAATPAEDPRFPLSPDMSEAIAD